MREHYEATISRFQGLKESSSRKGLSSCDSAKCERYRCPRCVVYRLSAGARGATNMTVPGPSAQDRASPAQTGSRREGWKRSGAGAQACMHRAPPSQRRSRNRSCPCEVRQSGPPAKVEAVESFLCMPLLAGQTGGGALWPLLSRARTGSVGWSRTERMRRKRGCRCALDAGNSRTSTEERASAENEEARAKMQKRSVSSGSGSGSSNSSDTEQKRSRRNPEARISYALTVYPAGAGSLGTRVSPGHRGGR